MKLCNKCKRINLDYWEDYIYTPPGTFGIRKENIKVVRGDPYGLPDVLKCRCVVECAPTSNVKQVHFFIENLDTGEVLLNQEFDVEDGHLGELVNSYAHEYSHINRLSIEIIM